MAASYTRAMLRYTPHVIIWDCCSWLKNQGHLFTPTVRQSISSATGSNFKVITHGGTIIARDVIVASNGYTGKITPWQRRRVIPIGSYMIATEPLPSGLMDELMPRQRIFSDTRKVSYYFRAISGPQSNIVWRSCNVR